MLVHGYTAPATAWGPTVDALLAAGHRAIAFDRRAHGESETPSHGQRMARHGRDLGGLLEHLDLRAPSSSAPRWAATPCGPTSTSSAPLASRVRSSSTGPPRCSTTRPGRTASTADPHRHHVSDRGVPQLDGGRTVDRSGRRRPAAERLGGFRLPRQRRPGDPRPVARRRAAGPARRRPPLPVAAADARGAREPGLVVRARRRGGGRYGARPRPGRRGRGPRDQHRPARPLQPAPPRLRRRDQLVPIGQARYKSPPSTRRRTRPGSRSAMASAPTAPCGAVRPTPASSRPAPPSPPSIPFAATGRRTVGTTTASTPSRTTSSRRCRLYWARPGRRANCPAAPCSSAPLLPRTRPRAVPRPRVPALDPVRGPWQGCKLFPATAPIGAGRRRARTEVRGRGVVPRRPRPTPPCAWLRESRFDKGMAIRVFRDIAHHPVPDRTSGGALDGRCCPTTRPPSSPDEVANGLAALGWDARRSRGSGTTSGSRTPTAPGRPCGNVLVGDD